MMKFAIDARPGVVVRLLRMLVLASLLPCSTAPARAAAPAVVGASPSIATFFRNPDLHEAKLSPSGHWLAITTASQAGRVLLAVVDLDGIRAVHAVASFSDTDVRSFDWVNDERLIFNTTDLDAAPADRSFGPGLFSVRRDGSEMRTLIRLRSSPVSSEARIGVQPLEADHVLLTVIHDGSNDVIVGQVRADSSGDLRSITPKRLDVVTGRTSSIAFGIPDRVTAWLFDDHGAPRVAVRETKGVSEILWHPAPDAPWQSLASFPAFNAPFAPIAVGPSGELYVSTAAHGAAALERFDFATGKPDGKPILRMQGFDFDGVPVFDRDSSRLLGVRYEADAWATAWLDPAMKRLQAVADQRFPGRTNLLTCRRCTDDGVLLVQSFSEQDPGSFWLYRANSDTWDAIGKVRRDIDPSQMGQLDMYRFKTRDGLEIPVWETRPAHAPKTPLPAVVLVHGGPWVRGVHWEWNPDAQFLASRGYVVIEPEFRGSTGYGRELLTRGFKQWGLAMQDDVADAVAWAAARGDIDPKRVCIAGASYGGYATLMGLVRQPDLYRCGVAWVAVTDPRLLLEDDWRSDASTEAREYTLPMLIGDPDKDAALLRDAAPVEHAAEIRAPLLMAFGGVDRRVPLRHGERLKAAMEKAGLAPQYIVYDGEGHGWQKVENRVDFWNRVEGFLADALK
jgi:acetyl esterase/lipase